MNLYDKCKWACLERMSDLLQMVTTAFPNARVIVTGYFPIISDDTPTQWITKLMWFFGFPMSATVTSLYLAEVKMRASMFHALTTSYLQTGVMQTNLALGHDRVYFVSPNFKNDEAMFAPKKLVFGFKMQGTTIVPEDVSSIFTGRASACSVLSPGDPNCSKASIGHPTKRVRKSTRMPSHQ